MIAGIADRIGRARLLAPLAALALSACATSDLVPAARLPGAAAPARAAAAPAQPSHGVIGVDARALIRLFGEPRLDIRDPAARKLQFAGAACILDAYLYPPRANREPVVTFAEARGPDGAAMDWVDCAGRLRQR